MKRRYMKWLFIANLWAVAAFAAWVAWEVYDPTRHIWGYSVYGIDVSKWQPSINWKTAKADGLAFVFIKATEGESEVDPKFKQYWAAATRTGWIKGGYHYYQPFHSPKKQARHFCNTIELKKGDLRPVIDIEEFPGKRLGEYYQNLGIFLEEVEQCLGVKPIIYSSRNYYNAFLEGVLSEDYPLWIANYQQLPTTKGDNLDREWQFWQYSNRGKVRGVQGNVDLNVFNGSFTELSDFCLK